MLIQERILNIEPERISGELEQDKIVIVAGFQGMNRYNDITTLGREVLIPPLCLAAALSVDIVRYTPMLMVFILPILDRTQAKSWILFYDEMLELPV